MNPTDGPDNAGQRPYRDVVIVPHTHWDREWYQGFVTCDGANRT